MRGFVLPAAVLLCSTALSACGGEPGPHVQGHPAGWTATKAGDTTVWIDPKNPREEYRSYSNPQVTGTLREAASQVTTHVLLTLKGTRYMNAVPYPACPGEAGLQTFSVRTPKGPSILRVAFTQWNGATLEAWYQRPPNVPDDRDALNAMTQTVCTAPAGVAKFPAAPSVQPEPTVHSLKPTP